MEIEIIRTLTLMISLFIMVWIIYTDTKHRHISNKACLILALSSIASATVFSFLPSAIIYSLIIFTLFFLIWYFGIMGAGDVKLITAFSLGIHPDFILIYFIAIGLFGGIQVAIMYLLSLVRGTTPFDKGIPYGVAISIPGVILSYASTFQ